MRREVLARLASTGKALSVAIVALDREAGARIVDVNPAFSQLTGHPRDVVVGASLTSLDGPEIDPATFAARTRAIEAGAAWQEAVPTRLANGGIRYLMWAFLPLEHEVLAILQPLPDDTDEVRQAERDPTVGLLNQVALTRRLQRMVTQAEAGEAAYPVVLAIQFDQLAALSGLDVGEGLGQFMAEHGKRLTAAVGFEALAFVAPDRFLAICPDIERIGLIRDNLQVPVIIDGVRHHTSATVGMALFPIDGSSAETLVRSAVLAATDSQRRGASGRLVPFQQDTADRFARAGALERSLGRVDGRQLLSVSYRPVVRLTDGSIAGAQAIVGWQDPAIGAVTMDELLPIAEKAGMLATVGAWTIEAAAREFATTPAAEGKILSIAVGGQQLAEAARPRLLAATAEATMQHSVGRGQMVFSLPAAMLSHPDVLATLYALRTLGAGIAVHGLGSVGTDFAVLAEAPVDHLILAPTLVHALAETWRAEAVARNLIALARDLDIRVQASGIDTADERDRLVGLGVDLGTGALFGTGGSAAGVLGG